VSQIMMHYIEILSPTKIRQENIVGKCCGLKAHRLAASRGENSPMTRRFLSCPGGTGQPWTRARVRNVWFSTPAKAKKYTEGAPA
jgi:hypothetical protein